jgi:hypothetical protein
VFLSAVARKSAKAAGRADHFKGLRHCNFGFGNAPGDDSGDNNRSLSVSTVQPGDQARSDRSVPVDPVPSREGALLLLRRSIEKRSIIDRRRW